MQRTPPDPLDLPSLAACAAAFPGRLAAVEALLQIGAIAAHLTGEDRRITLDIGLLATAAVTVWPATGR